MKAITSVVGIVLICIALFAIVNTVHSQFFPVHVILYDALIDVVIAMAISAVAILLWQWRNSPLSRIEKSQAIVIAGLICTLYAFVGPTIIDRSLSVYILEKLDQRGGGIRYDALPRVFINEYIPEYRLMDIRVTEQLNSGTIGLRGGCIYLTPFGHLVVDFTKIYRAHILPKKREIMGKLTNELTDPFRHSTSNVDYKCTPPAN